MQVFLIFYIFAPAFGTNPFVGSTPIVPFLKTNDMGTQKTRLLTKTELEQATHTYSVNYIQNRAIKEVLDGTKELIKTYMERYGLKEISRDGIVICRLDEKTIKGKFDVKKFQEEHPDLYEQYLSAPSMLKALRAVENGMKSLFPDLWQKSEEIILDFKSVVKDPSEEC